MIALMNFREDGITPYMLFFKDGIIEEKVVSLTIFLSVVCCSLLTLLLFSFSFSNEIFILKSLFLPYSLDYRS